MTAPWQGTVVVLTLGRCLNERDACRANVPLVEVRVDAVLSGGLAPGEGPFVARWCGDEREGEWAVRGGVDYRAWLTWPCEAPGAGERWIACVREGAWVPPRSDAPGFVHPALTALPPGARELIVAPAPREPWSAELEQRLLRSAR